MLSALAAPPPARSRAAAKLPVAGPGGQPEPAGAPGGLRVLDWAGFEAALSYTFDDSNSSQIDNYASLRALGVPFTFYLQTGKPESMNAIWAQAVRDGHELGNHTETHQLDGDTIAADTDRASRFIWDHFGVKAVTMAAPYGAQVYAEVARTRFLVNRGVSDQAIAPGDSSDPFDLACHVPAENASAHALNTKLDRARSSNQWQIVLIHGFTGGSDGAYRPIELEQFVAAVEYAKHLGGVWIDTVAKIGAYWRAQKLWQGLTPTLDGDNEVYTWKLPENFPSGQVLRVTLNGGRLSQNGVALPWNDHGFYEVSLDAGNVTLSPTLEPVPRTHCAGLTPASVAMKSTNLSWASDGKSSTSSC